MEGNTPPRMIWDAILTAAKDISSDKIERLKSSIDQRLFSLINKNGSLLIINCTVKAK